MTSIAEEYSIQESVDPNNKSHYIDNERFYNEISEYKAAYDKAVELGEELPRINNYLGSCILKITKGLAMKHNFRNYSFINDMRSTATEICIRNMHSFDPTKSKNPFSYFTQVCFFAFIGVIQKEKKQSAVKRKMMMSSAVDTFSLQDHDDGEFVANLQEYMNSLGVDDEKPKEKKIKVIGALEGFFDE